jgi:YgiT-type zinc finger domain-containing protein
MGGVVSTEFGFCPCGGYYEPHTVDVHMTIDGEEITLDSVKQGRCPDCGSRVYKASELEDIEALIE